MNSIFNGCLSLIIFPDISKWNINNNINIINNISDQNSSNYSFNNKNESYHNNFYN